MSVPGRVIAVEDVHKRYRLGVTDHRLISEEISALFGRITRGRSAPEPPPPGTEDQRSDGHFWSLRGVSLDVAEGEVLGLIGRNGAGKSTLLKLLSRITLPTSGRIRMRGRVSSLLEVGTGFHQELTGLENIYLNGAILGMRKREIDRKLDEIIAFSGIEDHIGTPIKRYSSGMKVRLGFSVAAHLEPEILIVDEVLAVGDAEFQRKCLGSLRNVAASGRTIIFVSHNMVSVQSLCTRVIWLEKGVVRDDGDTDDVVRKYVQAFAEHSAAKQWPSGSGPGADGLELRSIKATGAGPDEGLVINEPVHITIDFTNQGLNGDDLDIRLFLRTANDVLAFVTGSAQHAAEDVIWPIGLNRVQCIIPADLLNDEIYRVEVQFVRRGHLAFKVQDAITLDPREGSRAGSWMHKWHGVVRPRLQWIR